MSAPARRPRLLVLNQYYWPGVEATANLLTELCEGLAVDYDVSVVTGRLRGRDSDPGFEHRNGVEIHRVASSAFDRASLPLRAANYASYLGLGALRALRLGRPDVVLCMTDPPVIGDIALLVARRFRAPVVVVSEDVFPEIAVELQRLQNPVLVGLLRVLTRFYLRHADRVVAIGETMETRLEAKGAEPERISVIPNWTDTTSLVPQPRDNEWSRANELVSRFVVMHSGNVGYAQDLDTLIRATTFLRDIDELRTVIIGFGAQHAVHAALAARLETSSVQFLPYQPRESLAQSLSSAEIHFVGLGRGLSGYVVPSRLYGILAVSRPVIAAVDSDSETARVVREVGCGIVIPPERPDILARRLREVIGGEHDLEEMGKRGRDYVTAEADRDVAIGRYRALLDEVRA